MNNTDVDTCIDFQEIWDDLIDDFIKYETFNCGDEWDNTSYYHTKLIKFFVESNMFKLDIIKSKCFVDKREIKFVFGKDNDNESYNENEVYIIYNFVTEQFTEYTENRG